MTKQVVMFSNCQKQETLVAGHYASLYTNMMLIFPSNKRWHLKEVEAAIH